MKNKKSPSFTFKKGTTLMLGSEPVVLTEDAELHFDAAENEQTVVGMLVHSKNLDINREQLKAGYNGFGAQTHTPEQLRAALAKESEATAAQEREVEEEFEQVQQRQEERAGGRPVEPVDPNNVPSDQRAPALGSPQLKDVEKMENMDNMPGDKGFSPLASKPRENESTTSSTEKSNESADSIVENHQVTDRANINGAPNTAVKVAKQNAGDEQAPPDSALTTSTASGAGTSGSTGGTESTDGGTTKSKDVATATAKTAAPKKAKTAVKKTAANAKTVAKVDDDSK